MSVTKLLKNTTKMFAKLGFKASKHAPEIFMYAGIAGTVTATVIACKKTEGMNNILEDHKGEVTKLKEEAETTEMTMSTYRKELTKVYATTAAKTVRNYALPFALGIASVGSIMYGHHMLRKWYVDTSIALGAMTKDYNNLYDNLVAEVGEEKAKEIKAGIITEEVEEVEVNSKGKEKVVKKEVKRLSDKGSSYTLHWNEYFSDNWRNDYEMNVTEIMLRMNSLNVNIKNRYTGHLFWWEAVEFLFGTQGLKKIIDDMKRRGIAVPMMAGWVYDPNLGEDDRQVPFEVILEPGTKSDVLLTLIPNKNIYEFGKATDLIA